MVRNVCSRWNLSYLERTISVVILISHLLSVAPLQGFCDLKGVYAQDFCDRENLDLFVLKFDEIKKMLISTENRNVEVLKSIQSLLNEVNSMYSMNLSVDDLFESAKFHLVEMNVNQDVHLLLNLVINNLQATYIALGLVITETIFEPIADESRLHSQHFGVFGYGIYAPWEWNWFGINKKQKEKKHVQYTSRQVTYPGPIPEDNGSIPDDLIICGVEALVIGLLLLIPSGYTQALAVAIGYDMGTRGIDAIKTISEANKESIKNSLSK